MTRRIYPYPFHVTQKKNDCCDFDDEDNSNHNNINEGYTLKPFRHTVLFEATNAAAKEGNQKSD